ncbi:MAG TPA: calcium/sodium antiporter [Leucothrix mucor]|nr:calcium/sodium antiporter [Leucothrix mucor]
MLLFTVAVILGLILLIWSADQFVDGAAGLAQHWGISPLIIGMLIIGLGTSAPEMLVAATAALQGSPDIGIGNAIGSNITNITLVLGITALIVTLPIHSNIVKKELPLILFAGLLAWFLLYDGDFSQLDGMILLACLFTAIGGMIYSSKKVSNRHDPLLEESIEELPAEMPFKKALLWMIIGIVVLMVSSKMLVWGASNIASQLGISDLVIGLTIVAIGTSLPELAASISSVRKGEIDLAIGNIVGSNLFNTLGVLAIPALISPSAVAPSILSRDMPIMIALTVLLIVFGFGCFTHARYKIVFWKGAIFLSLFIAYEGLLYYQTMNA